VHNSIPEENGKLYKNAVAENRISAILDNMAQNDEELAAWADLRPLIQTLRLAVENHWA
jgi:hypothetical protein